LTSSQPSTEIGRKATPTQEKERLPSLACGNVYLQLSVGKYGSPGTTVSLKIKNQTQLGL